ncbi:MAG: hypothetical protein JXR30_00940 [Alphaproteobacteria bacterium]|nr:hypothetical protein [Alphaproteobacteria bacterium]
MTITSTDDDISRFMEVRASSAQSRLQALKKLNDAGLKTYTFIGPLLPNFNLHPEKLEQLFKAIRDTGTQEIYVEHLNMKPYILQRLQPILKKESETVLNIYLHKNNIRSQVHELAEKYSFKLRLGETIEHEK